MEMTDLMRFDFAEDHVVTPTHKFYFYEIKAPNFTTLSETESEGYHNQFQRIMRETAEVPFRIIALDKTVSLRKNHEFIESLSDRYEEIKTALINDLKNIESVSGNTERSYYYSIRINNQSTPEKFEDILKTAGVNFIKATKPELVTIMRCFNLREFVDNDIFSENDEPLLYGKKKIQISPIVRHLLPTKLKFDMDHIVQTGFYRKSYVVRNLPSDIRNSNKDFLKDIIQLPNTTCTIYIEDMPSSQVRDLVNKQYSNSAATMGKRKVTDVLEARDQSNTLTTFYQDCMKSSGAGGVVKLVNIFIETYGNTLEELGKNCTKLRNSCLSHDVTVEDFRLRQKDGYFGVSPIGHDTRGKKLANNIPSNTMGRLYPFSMSYLNDVIGMILGRTVDNGLIDLDIWVRTLERTNSNIAVIGDSGQGKSYLLKKIIAFLRAMGVWVFCIDSEGEYCDLFRNMGGTNVNCSNGSLTINPLEIRAFARPEDEEDEQAPAAFNSKTSPYFQHLSWLKDFIPVLFPDIGSMELRALLVILRDVYKLHNIDEDTDLSTLKSTDFPIFEDVYQHIEQIVKDPEQYNVYLMISDSTFRNLLLLLDDVCYGTLSPQFNHHTNLPNMNFVNLDIQELLMGSSDNMQAVLFNYLTYIWSRVVAKQNRLALVTDELYLLLNADNPIVLKYYNQFERRSRKYEASLIVGTQKIMDCLDDRVSTYTSAIFDTPTYKFLFFPGEVDFHQVRKKLNLTKGEIDSISTSQQRNCLLKIGKEKYHMTVGSLPYEAKLFGKGGGR